jgi:hypothetical protein
MDSAGQFVDPGGRDERVVQGMMGIDRQSPDSLGQFLRVQLLDLSYLHRRTCSQTALLHRCPASLEGGDGSLLEV